MMRRNSSTAILVVLCATLVALHFLPRERGNAAEVPPTFLAASHPEPNAIHVSEMTARRHRIFFPPTEGATLKLGVVVDMSRPPFILKESLRLDCKESPIVPISDSTARVVTRQDTSSDARQTAMLVEASVSAFGGGGSGRLSSINEEFDRIRQNAVYAHLSIIDGKQILEGRPKWPNDWKLPEESDGDKLKAFVDEYGTHYVERLLYGRSFFIKATLREESKQRREELEAKLRTNLWTFSLNAEYAKRAKQELAGYQFDLLVSIQGGKADRPEQLLIRNLEELNQFIDNLRGGKFSMESVPVAADLLSLSPYVNDRAVRQGLRGEVKYVTDGTAKIKDIRMFEKVVLGDTTQRESSVIVEFPEPVDYVVITGLGNDNHDMIQCNTDKIGDGKTWKVTFLSARNEGVRWIPGVRLLGMKLVR